MVQPERSINQSNFSPATELPQLDEPVVVILAGQTEQLEKEGQFINPLWKFVETPGQIALAIPISDLKLIINPREKALLEEAALHSLRQIVRPLDEPISAMEIYNATVNAAGESKGYDRAVLVAKARTEFVQANLLPGIFAYLKVARSNPSIHVASMEAVLHDYYVTSSPPDSVLVQLQSKAKLLNARLGFLNDSVRSRRG